MLQDRAMRERVKRYLVGATAVLISIFVLLSLYGLVSVRPYKIEKALQLGQYYKFDSHHLPAGEKVMEQKELYLARSHNRNPELEEKSQAEIQSTSLAKPKIAIIVTNLGLNAMTTDLALSLPKEVALGFVPYTKTLKSLIGKAQQKGHEVFMYMPFETKRYPTDDPGHMPLLLSNSMDENVTRMHQLLGHFQGYIGIYAAPNEIFTTNADALSNLISEITKHKLKLLVSRTDGEEIATGEHSGLVMASNVLIDSDPNIVHIKKQLDKLVMAAKEKNFAVGYANSYPVTLYTLKAWIAGLESSGVEIVPVSYLFPGFLSSGSAADATHQQ